LARPVAVVVEDQPEFQLLLRRLLEDEGFRVHECVLGAPAVDLVRTAAPDLVVLDVTLPDIDGVEICRLIREFSDVYVVMVSARHEEIDKVLAFSVGADDYVTKPFGKRELAARFRALKRRPRHSAAPPTRTFGELSVDPAAHEARLGGILLDLTRTEYGLLDALTARHRHVFSRQDLREIVWGDSDWGDDHIVDVHIANLRKKLGETGGDQRFIHTVRGVGFRFEPDSG
jgi:DNA-binding response OmpR family regulator